MTTDRKEIFKLRFKEHYPRLCNIAYGYVADMDDSEDIVQDLFVTVWNNGKDSLPEKEFAAYITTAVKNCCVSFLRKKCKSTISIDDTPASGADIPDDEALDSEAKEPLSQVSLFYENNIRVTDKFTVRAGIHLVGYIPDNYRSYYSAQPRLALNYSPTDNDLLYINFSRMEQFYHYLSFNGMALPTDFRMPSIEGFRPRTSEHYETGWKRNRDDEFRIDDFRRHRFPFNYRIDAGYTFRKDFGDKQLFLRCGLYNILGNPPEEDIIYFYTVHWSGNCMPYAGVSFRF